MMKKINLYQLNREIKLFLSLFLISLTFGVIVGLIYLYQTTSYDKENAVERFSEREPMIEEDFGINEASSRSIGELLMTTHNHIIGFSFIFFFIGAIFYFNTIVSGFWKIFLIGEPFISTLLSFGSMWAVRYWGVEFIYITIISAMVMYLSFFIMVIISLYELTLKQHA